MILKESDAYDLSQALQRAPGASHSRGRTVLVENLSYSTSLSGLLRQFEGFHMQEHAATLLEAVCPLATASSGCIKFLHVSAISNPLNQSLQQGLQSA